jgi:hypothetical protein
MAKIPYRTLEIFLFTISRITPWLFWCEGSLSVKPSSAEVKKGVNFPSLPTLSLHGMVLRQRDLFNITSALCHIQVTKNEFPYFERLYLMK